MGITPNLGLTTYNATTDLTKKFLEYYQAIAGLTTSNMTKIDDFAGSVASDFSAVDGRLDAIEANNWVTTTRILNSAVTATKLATDSVETAKIKDLNVTSGKLAANSIIAGKIATGGVSATAQLADNIVDDTKVGNRVPQLYRRQGGDASLWNVAGSTNYTPGAVRMQVGSYIFSTADYETVTFPVAFSSKPIVFAILDTGYGDIMSRVNISIIQPSYFTCAIWSVNYSTGSYKTQGSIFWLAIGAE